MGGKKLYAKMGMFSMRRPRNVPSRNLDVVLEFRGGLSLRRRLELVKSALSWDQEVG